MSISLYFEAKRPRPLSSDERTRLAAILAACDRTAEAEHHAQTGRGLNWEPLSFYPDDPDRPERILDGAIKLPDNRAFAVHTGARHWADTLARIRREVAPDAAWSAQIDESELRWSADKGWHDQASDGFAALWLGCLVSAPFRWRSARRDR